MDGSISELLMPHKVPLNLIYIIYEILEIDLRTSLGSDRGPYPGPDPGPDPGPRLPDPCIPDPSISDLNNILYFSVTRPYEPIKLRYSSNEPQTGLGWVPGIHPPGTPTLPHHPGYTLHPAVPLV